MRSTAQDIRALKGQRKVSVLTAYDYPFAGLVDKAGIDIVLVGDSLANVVLGLDSTTQVGMSELIYHSKAVSRAVKNALVVGDMPFESYQLKPELAVMNARRFTEEAGCGAVKVEWFDRCLEVVRSLVEANIQVMGHIGLTPQTAEQLGGFKVQGKDAAAVEKLIGQAQALEKAGCFSMVIECVPAAAGGQISRSVGIPTIGIGAGPQCDGQVLVIHDLLGLYDRKLPKFVKKFAQLDQVILDAVTRYKQEVEQGVFPDKDHSY
jgi:3-methyl-2-oxobutanoate hydroxymethyltransferase